MARTKQLLKKSEVAGANRGLFDVDPLVDPVYQDGKLRSFLLTTPTPKLIKNRKIQGGEYILLAILIITSLFVRLSFLATPNSVVFDEVHFGGFARKYILGQFFMDVHPPLAKMLFAAVGYIFGFDGEFQFKNIGDEFPANVPYVYMRSFPALLGVGTIILCYLTLRNSGVRPIVAFLTASCLMIENANATISRYILLDSPLLFFIAASIYALKKFEIQIPFSFGWFKSLIATGIALGLAVSSKWVGLFTIAWVGISCLFQLWFIIGDLSISSKKIVGHFVARGALLLGIPALLYVVFFGIHFQVLSNEGDGGPFMTSAFRSNLNGNTIPRDITANVGLGSIITIRHLETRGGYLHSHNNFYPTGSKQQQITLYPHLDTNNNWLIEPYNDTIPDHFVPLTDNMKIRLVHINTGRRLHSHDEKPPVSERDWQKEASCYGFEGFAGDANDDFIVEIVKHKSKSTGDEVKALNTIIRFRHAMTGHYLFSSEVKLPDWGFDQQEVTTASQGYRPLTHWYIETNENDRIPANEKEIINYPKLSLWDKILESHKTMWKINQGLTEHHNWQSSPTEWPLLLRGINYWVRENKQVYFLGNAVVWWSSTLCIVAFLIHTAFSIIRWQSGQKVADNKHVFNFNTQVFLYLAGWGLHYLPFFIMGRQLFLHHYIPAAYFGILVLGHFFDIFVNYLAASSKHIQKIAYVGLSIFLMFSLVFYIQLSPLVYGKPWTKPQCNRVKGLNSWDFDCNAFFDSYEDYSVATASALASASESIQLELAKISAVPVENQADYKEAEETPLQVELAQEEAHESEFPNEVSEEAPIAEEVIENQNNAPPAAVDLEETDNHEKVESVKQAPANEETIQN